MLKILQARLQQYTNQEFPDVQAGFRKGRGRRGQISIIQKSREYQKNICVTDNATAFYCVDHNKFWKILKEMGIPDHLTCFPRNLYADQEATEPNMEQRTGSKLGMEYKEVRQGCILSLCLFNLASEYIMQNARLDEAPAGIKIAGRTINNLRYASWI